MRKLKDRVTPRVNNVQRKPFLENISEAEARTTKNESRKGASGKWMWMDDVGKGDGGGGERYNLLDRSSFSRGAMPAVLSACRDLAERCDVVYVAYACCGLDMT